MCSLKNMTTNLIKNLAKNLTKKSGQTSGQNSEVGWGSVGPMLGGLRVDLR